MCCQIVIKYQQCNFITIMIKHLFDDERLKQFNLSCPDLDIRKKTFIDKSLQILAYLDRDHWLDVVFDDTEMTKIADLQNISLPSQNKHDELIQSLHNGSRSWEPSPFFLVLQHASDDYYTYLAYVDTSLQIFLGKSAGNSSLAPVKSGAQDIIGLFDTLTLDYVWSTIRNRLERQLTQADLEIINENEKMIQEKENAPNLRAYDSCIDEFLILKISNQPGEHKRVESLNALKRVFERSLMNRHGLQLNNKRTVVEKLLNGNGEYDEVTQNIEFIVKNIHHDQKNEKGVSTSRRFSRGEYIYWWLERNKLIYLVLSG